MDLTEREERSLKLCLQHLEADRVEGMAKWLETQSLEELNKQFNNPTGQHEACDRAFMLLETWEHYVMNHAFVTLNPEAYRIACLTHALMMESYNLIATLEAEDAKN